MDLQTFLTQSIPLLTQAYVFEPDAIVMVGGLGDKRKMDIAVGVVERLESEYLIVLGAHKDEKTFVEWGKKKIKGQYGLVEKVGFEIICHSHHNHAKHQADVLAKEVRKNSIGSICLVVRAYHGPRIWLSVLKSLIDVGIAVGEVMISLCYSDETHDDVIPETGQRIGEVVEAELARIPIYQKKGDLASWEEVEEFMGCLEKHRSV